MRLGNSAIGRATGQRIVGHVHQRRELERLLVAQKLPPTMIFAGTAGIGKALLAKELARTLLCEQDVPRLGGCLECKACHLFKVGNHPDFHLVQCADKEHGAIQNIRELLYSLNLNPFAGSSRVVIFNDAEHLSGQAANTLLKTLEEPRANSFFILVSANSSKLPHTLRSRCQSWFFDALSVDEISEILANRAEQITSDLSLDELALLADGSLENVEKVAAHAESWREITRKLDCVAEGNLDEAVRLSHELGKNREGLRIQLQLLRIRTRDCLLRARQGEEYARWAVLLTNIIAAERLIFERNLNAQQVLITTFANATSVAELDTDPRYPNRAILLDKITV